MFPISSTQTYSASWEKFSAEAVDASIFKLGLDGLRGLVEGMTALNKATGGMAGLAATIGAVAVAGKALGGARWFENLKQIPQALGKLKFVSFLLGMLPQVHPCICTHGALSIQPICA